MNKTLQKYKFIIQHASNLLLVFYTRIVWASRPDGKETYSVGFKADFKRSMSDTTSIKRRDRTRIDVRFSEQKKTTPCFMKINANCINLFFQNSEIQPRSLLCLTNASSDNSFFQLLQPKSKLLVFKISLF